MATVLGPTDRPRSKWRRWRSEIKFRWRLRRRAINLRLRGCVLLLLLYAFVIEPLRLVVRETTISLPTWPAEFRDLRVTVFSDLHVGPPHIPPRVALTIVGHTHGGQVWLPFIGRPVLRGQPYTIGHFVEGGRHLFVTPGIGASIFPVRFGVPPEISVLTIK